MIYSSLIMMLTIMQVFENPAGVSLIGSTTLRKNTLLKFSLNFRFTLGRVCP